MKMTSLLRQQPITASSSRKCYHSGCRMQQSLADEIAFAALHHYHHVLPLKGKPKENEWTVYAAIVAISNYKELQHVPYPNDVATKRPRKNKIWVVSCATGTKCCAIQSMNQNNDKNHADMQCCHILRDSHAEVLARRGFVRVLWNEMIHNTIETTKQENQSTLVSLLNDSEYQRESCEYTGDTQNILRKVDGSADAIFTLRDDIELHMYISDSPCGDASIYEIQQMTPTTIISSPTSDICGNDYNNNNNNNNIKTSTSAKLPLNKFTGSKAIVVDSPKIDSDHHSSAIQQPQVRIIREKDQQTLGQLRTKSGRSNIDPNRRSTSMSCSDKLVRWSIFGLQGTVLSRYIMTPIRFTSIIVGCDPAAADVVTTIIESKASDRVDPSTGPMESTQTIALQRAVPNRVHLVQQYLRDSKVAGSSMQSVNESVLLQKYINDITIPLVFTSTHTFERGKAIVEYASANTSATRAAGASFTKPGKRKRNDRTDEPIGSILISTKVSVTGIALNWHQNVSHNTPTTTPVSERNDVELIIGARGIRQGKKPKCRDDAKRLQSQLCRKELWSLHDQFLSIVQGRHNHSATEESSSSTTIITLLPTPLQVHQDDYNQYKQTFGHPVYRMIRDRVFCSNDTGSPLAGWLVGDDPFGSK